MSESIDARKSLSRRSFLRAAGFTAGALGVFGAAGMLSADGWLEPADAQAAVDEHTAATYHQAHCEGNCSLKCTVRDGRMCLIQPSEWDNPKDRTVCLKGLAEIEHVYSSERIQSPLKLVGERGSGEFVPITWDEAWMEIADRLGSLREKYGDDCVLYQSTSENDSTGLLPSIMHMQIGLYGGIDYNYPNGIDPAFGYPFALYNASPETLTATRTLINFGANPYESDLTRAGYLNAAKDAGCELITIDPHFSTTAGKSDHWISINPGTDPALLLGMATAILDNGWQDESFMAANTSFPFLVNASDGTVVRDPVDPAKLVGLTEAEAALITGKPYIWDTVSNSAQLFDAAGVMPALEGTFVSNGSKVTTVYSLVKENAKKHTTSWAAGITGIDESAIVGLADKYANQKPAVLMVGYGSADKYTNGDIAGHAMTVLAAMTGNIGVEGGTIGAFSNNYVIGPATLGTWPLPEDAAPSPSTMDIYEMPYNENNVHAIVSFGDISNRVANYNVMTEWYKKLDFILTVDPFYSPSIPYADIVLPACTRFENSEEIGGVKVVYDRIMLRQKVIEPLFESKTDFEIERGIAACFGLEDLLPESAEEYARVRFETGEGFDGIAFDDVIDNDGIYALPFEPFIAFTDQIYATPSGKFDPYYETLLTYGQALPTYEAPGEVYDGNPLADKYPLKFCQPRTRFRLHTQFSDAEWIRQFLDDYIELNPVDMANRGLTHGDTVEVFNDRGSFRCPVHANESVRPGCTRMFEGSWPKYLKAGHYQTVTNDRFAERGYVNWYGTMIPYNDTLIEIKKAGE